LRLDWINGNNSWYRVILKEMANIKIAFEILDEEKQTPPGYRHLTAHMIFDVKMDFTRKETCCWWTPN